MYNCCKYLLWHTVLIFCYFVCVMPYIVVPARRVGAEARLQERDRLIYDISWFNELWWTMKSWSLMLWTVKFPPTSYLMIRWSPVFVSLWFRDVASPIPSWHHLRRGGVTFAKTILTYCVALCKYSSGFGSNFRLYVRLRIFPIT